MTANDLQGKVALVTGAGQGIGLAVAHELAAHGADVAINDISPERLEVAAASFATPPTLVAGDVTVRGEVNAMVATVVATLGSVDILINNAGILRPTRLIDIPEEEWDDVINVNLKSTFLCSQAVLPSMISRKWGRIVNLSSTAGKSVSTIGGAHYTAAKAGILGLTRHLASEVARDGITVNAICPGLVDTTMTRSTITPAEVDRYARSFPVARLGTAEEIAGLISFLASDRGEYITGASVDINGGDLMI